MEYPLVTSLNLRVKRVSSRVRCASMTVLGLELDHLRHELGYAGMGSWQQFRDEVTTGERPRWERYCRVEAGITEATARNYLKCSCVIEERLRKSPEPGAVRLADWMKIQPSKLELEQRESLIEGIARIGILEGETMVSIKAQYQAPDWHGMLDDAAAKVDSSPRNKPLRSLQARSMEALALAVGVSPENARRVAMIVTAREFKETMREIREEMIAEDGRH